VYRVYLNTVKLDVRRNESLHKMPVTTGLLPGCDGYW
jgi:hypothetical protein